MVWIDMLYIAKGGAVVGHLPKKLSLTVHMEWCDSLPYGGGESALVTRKIGDSMWGIGEAEKTTEDL